MADNANISQSRWDIYDPDSRSALLVAMVSFAIITPILFVAHLQPVMTFFPIVALTGIILIRTGRPNFIPTWIVFNIFSLYFIIYAAYSFGTTFSTEILVLVLLGMVVYDVVGVQGGQMQSMAGRMISYGVPVFILVPHSRSFTFEGFQNVIKEDGLEGLHESDHGISMLGIGDGFLPASLAVSAGTIGVAAQVGTISITIPQIGIALGGIVGLSLLMYADLPKAVAALIVSVPGALIGFGLGLLVDLLLFG